MRSEHARGLQLLEEADVDDRDLASDYTLTTQQSLVYWGESVTVNCEMT